ncbi:MAG: FAD-dependent oxidoreductase [Gallionella sp.]|nr:FAD-dependent oxidoreductase [Gallionella sp.]
MNDSNYDIAIIGGGPVGAALALALRDSNLKVCVLEARPAKTASADARALALSYGSRLLLERLGIWNKMQDVSAIRSIHISQKQSFGRVMLRAEEMNVPELGYVLPYPTLQDALTRALTLPSPAGGITSHLSACGLSGLASCFTRGAGGEGRTIYGAQVTELRSEADHAIIGYQLDGIEHTLQTHLAVVADGGKLLAEQHPPEFHDYDQSAVIAHVTCANPKSATAFERFTPQGPLALLPYKDGYEIVWTAPHQRAQAMLDWDDAQFLNELHQHFGDRVGEFLTVGTRSCFPLGLKKAPAQSPMPHVVLLGNAAQTMHPVAGQGFNLGLRDAWDLAQVILDAKPESLGTEPMLATYRSSRHLDREAGIRFTDSLVRLFSNDLPLISAARAASLTVLDCLPFAKRFVAKRMMFGANG